MSHEHSNRDSEACAADLMGQSRDKLGGIIILIVSTAALVASYLIPMIGTGPARVLSAPGLTPALISIVLMALSSVLIARNIHAPLSACGLKFGATEKRMLWAFSIVAGYIASLYLLPYWLSTFLMMAIFQYKFASRKRSLTYLLFWCFAYSAAISGALYYVFGEVFFIPLP